MSTIVMQAFITLDGIDQAGGGPDERARLSCLVS
jgi:hypothetical protein